MRALHVAELNRTVAYLVEKLDNLRADHTNLNNRVEASTVYGVAAGIHPEDFIYHFVMNHAQFLDNPKAAIDYYFSTGDESAKCLINLKQDLGINGAASLLEFASGYGCVTRHLTRHSEEFQTTACDIHQPALDFIKQSIKVPCIQSSNIPENFQSPKQYQVVFALSFFSHLPLRTWGRWLSALFRSVEPGGYLIFTTHGFVSQKMMISHAQIAENGFWFDANSEQHDLDSAEYGTAITTPSFVREEIGKLASASIFIFKEGYWWKHQDLWVVKKEN
ncbi:MAG: hypothetical protein JWQ21_2992 [Herminiimonas sp.]|nr:hypothetical protein [Herminiimonas sp.]